jgi:DNA-binding MarR family transcriptional regulator
MRALVGPKAVCAQFGGKSGSRSNNAMDCANICQYIYLIQCRGAIRSRLQTDYKMQTGKALRATVSDPQRTTGDDINNRLFFRLFQTANIYETQAVRHLNISGVQGAVLGALSREPKTGMPFASLYAYLSVSRQNLDAVLKGLERHNYVERTESQADRRSRDVRLTPAGVRAWSELQEQIRLFFRQGTSKVSQAEIVACAETLSKIGRALKGLDLEDSKPSSRKTARKKQT